MHEEMEEPAAGETEAGIPPDAYQPRSGNDVALLRPPPRDHSHRERFTSGALAGDTLGRSRDRVITCVTTADV